MQEVLSIWKLLSLRSFLIMICMHKSGYVLPIFKLVWICPLLNLLSRGWILGRNWDKKKFSSLLFTTTSSNGFYPPPPTPPNKSGLKIACNANVVYTETSSLRTFKIMPRNLNEIVRSLIRIQHIREPNWIRDSMVIPDPDLYNQIKSFRYDQIRIHSTDARKRFYKWF
jgi:hypothetical protein